MYASPISVNRRQSPLAVSSSSSSRAATKRGLSAITRGTITRTMGMLACALS